MVSQISKISFGILSDTDVLQMSVCVVDTASLTECQGSVYDPKMGCVSNTQTCITCGEGIWQCPGHYGHINLCTPVILFYKQCVTMLKIFCLECSRLMCSKSELLLNGVHGYERTVDFITKQTLCAHCKTPHPMIRLNTADYVLTAHHKYKSTKATKELTPIAVKAIFDNIPTEDVRLLGVDTALFHPRNLVRCKFLVLPICCRPRMVTSTTSSDDDLTLLLVDIVKNNKLAETFIRTSRLDDPGYAKAVSNIKFKTLAYCDNSKGKATHTTNHKPLTGIKERITRKGGIFRQNLMGKRCDKTARTVVGPDPTLRLDEVCIPPFIANTLTIPENVTPLNQSKLTELVNTGGAATLIKPSGTKINIPHARAKKGTQLHHGDVVVCGLTGRESIVLDCRRRLRETDKVYRNGVQIETCTPVSRHISLEIGDKVERYLRDGDPLLLNRQPTLHRNSMQGMRAVIKPGKTIRVNLAIVTGFNMDFDGDEGNLFDEETLESMAELRFISNAKNNILSAQANKPEMIIVQDSLLAAYKMTVTVIVMTRDDFMSCLVHTSAFNRYPDYLKRLNEIQTLRHETDRMRYTACGLFGFILPNDFHYTYPHLTIRHGVVVDGYFDKSVLKDTRNSLIRILCLEYGQEEAAAFIDDIQFLTNAWLTIHGFTIGVSDCLMRCRRKKQEIKDMIQKYFIEANQVEKITDIDYIRESRVNCSLNKAKDIGLRIAKDALAEDNNFISTVVSGSKGDYFNIAQITGLLGQQNLQGERIQPTLDNRTRTSIHYPRVVRDVERKYESRGFISSSFIEGLNPKEMFFHAMTGREGMINTAMGTATSGYIQRSCVKLNEDLKVAYDGTVRDANGNIYQFAYGNHGYDPCKVTFMADGNVQVLDVSRLANRLSSAFSPADQCKLSPGEIDRIIAKCKWTCQIPVPVFNTIWGKHDRFLRSELDRVKIIPSALNAFERVVVEKYHTNRISPGESVGIIQAQSIGERQTQTNLNTFHTAGKLQETGVGRFEELLNMTKNIKVKVCKLFFKTRYASACELRAAVNSSVVKLTFRDVTNSESTISVTSHGHAHVCVSFKFDLCFKTLYEYRLSPTVIVEKLNNYLADKKKCEVSYTAKSITIQLIEELNDPPNGSELPEADSADKKPVGKVHDKVYWNITNESAASDIWSPGLTETVYKFKEQLDNLHICGIDGITNMYLDISSDGEWYAVTRGSNYKALLAHPLLDTRRLQCNNVWEVYECLGIAATRRMLFHAIKDVITGVNDSHIELLVDKMTVKGKPMSITRYTMRTADVGPLSKATFEESTDILIAAAMKTETDHNRGVSTAIISGNQPRIGTGMMSLKMDLGKFTPPSPPHQHEATYY